MLPLKWFPLGPMDFLLLLQRPIFVKLFFLYDTLFPDPAQHFTTPMELSMVSYTKKGIFDPADNAMGVFYGFIQHTHIFDHRNCPKFLRNNLVFFLCQRRSIGTEVPL
jgi:hypothetical protein